MSSDVRRVPIEQIGAAGPVPSPGRRSRVSPGARAMTSPRAGVLLVAAVLLGACTLVDEPADHTRSTTTMPTSADRAELRAELEWLLSPTRPCTAPSHLDATSIDEVIVAQLQTLGSEPDLASRCPEGDKQP